MQHYWDWFCTLPVAISVHPALTEMSHTCTCTRVTFDGQCRVKQLHYGFTLCCKLPLQGQVFIRLFAFRTILLINPPGYLTIWHLFSVVFYFMFVTIPPSCVTPRDLHHTDLAIYCFYFLSMSLFRMNSLQKKALLVEKLFFCFFLLLLFLCPFSHLVGPIWAADSVTAAALYSI